MTTGCSDCKFHMTIHFNSLNFFCSILYFKGKFFLLIVSICHHLYAILTAQPLTFLIAKLVLPITVHKVNYSYFNQEKMALKQLQWYTRYLWKKSLFDQQGFCFFISFSFFKFSLKKMFLIFNLELPVLF